ncbi:endonuclease/exonuclease/phosphatase family protein [Agarivorans aestuarii]|uniref:Endonuclease/exonuclease/phosphatase family protein n=1 Tax=Agarivorans aestuarii TaxID=1563703 RepID=A0ABU7G641_9ALTE|nr:endonuclease/exonuclease/phosphatase family protein [Agarivorans aestuarii]MEE1674479.1 endonuclease/exonuclease/phosphatase family protein [Agarivorans aestuarii]
MIWTKINWLQLSLFGLVLTLSACSSGSNHDASTTPLKVGYWPHTETARSPLPQLKVATLNLAHGRKHALNQLLVRGNTSKKNLLDIATYLREQNIDIVALQEADASSAWSGGFDHVAFLAQHAGYSWYAHSIHSSSKLANYGTAILSKYPISEALAVNFAPSPPTTSKGFTHARVALNSQQSLDVVSVHLDFSRASIRQQQLEQLNAQLQNTVNSTIIMGDFNSQGQLHKPDEVNRFLEQSPYRAFELGSKELASYKNKRLDWIFLSKDLRFVNYQVGPDSLSDHRPVISLIQVPAK